MIIPRGGCFAYSDQPTFGAVQVISSSPAPKAFGITAYHLGVSRTLAHLSDHIHPRISMVRSSLYDMTCPSTTFSESLLDTYGLIRWCQHVPDGSGGCDDRSSCLLE